MEAAATPLPREETTPPVTNTYLGRVPKALVIPPWSGRYKSLCRPPSRLSTASFYLGTEAHTSMRHNDSSHPSPSMAVSAFPAPPARHKLSRCSRRRVDHLLAFH